jgi:hypothetical protein
MAYFHAGAWEAGKTKNCEKTTSHGRELLFCDIEEFTARMDSLSGQSQANELVSQFRSQIDQAQTFAVTFEVPNSQRIFWECERTAGGIDCR